MDDQDLIELLADQASNPDYDYVAKLFYQYHESILGNHNGKLMFERMANIISDYNTSGRGKAIIQEYDAWTERSYILCVVTGLMCWVHEKVSQAGKVLLRTLLLLLFDL